MDVDNDLTSADSWKQELLSIVDEVTHRFSFHYSGFYGIIYFPLFSVCLAVNTTNFACPSLRISF